jgi:pimeloyl-ACP methyl ester carboxylesterase
MRRITLESWSRFFVVGAFTLLLLIAGQAQNAGTPPPLGKLVDVGGYRVHLYCIGNGSPTVVITGAGYSFDWGLVQPAVAKFTRVCAYDHSGVTWSDPGPTDSCSLRAGEIHTALTNAKISGPYVLVGHSLGGLVSRFYAAKYPSEVAGMVIVDHAFLMKRPPPVSGAVPPPPPPTSAPRPDPNRGFEKLPAQDYQLHVWANSLPGFTKRMDRNFAMVPECTSDVEAATRNQPTPLSDKPLIVLSTSNSAPAYVDFQSKLASLSSNSRQIVAENSSHYIIVDRPDLVISAIRGVVTAAQNHTKLTPRQALP